MVVSRILGSIFGQSQPGASPVTSHGAHVPDQLSDDARITVALDALLGRVRSSGRLLPGIISSQLRQLDDLLRALTEYVALRGASTEQRVLLEAIVVDYIGNPLSVYLNTTEAERVEDSRASVLFSSQLDVLYTTSKDLNYQIRSGAITELATHSRFLEDKFSLGSLSLTRGSD